MPSSQSCISLNCKQIVREFSTVHRLPGDPKRLNQWLQAMKRTDLLDICESRRFSNLKINYYVCDAHFSDAQKIPILYRNRNRTDLLRDAVPDQNLDLPKPIHMKFSRSTDQNIPVFKKRKRNLLSAPMPKPNITSFSTVQHIPIFYGKNREVVNLPVVPPLPDLYTNEDLEKQLAHGVSNFHDHMIKIEIEENGLESEINFNEITNIQQQSPSRLKTIFERKEELLQELNAIANSISTEAELKAFEKLVKPIAPTLAEMRQLTCKRKRL